MSFGFVFDTDTPTVRTFWPESPTAEAWRRWELASCVERHGGHLWELELHHPEDGSGVELCCAYCPAPVDDLHPDGHDLIAADFSGVQVEFGEHNSPVPLIVPVTAEVWWSKHWTDYGYEYDGGIEIEPRGPAREVEP